MLSSFMNQMYRTTNGMYEIGLVPGIQFTAQATDIGFNNIGFGIKMIIPDVFKQHGASHNLSGITDRILKQAKLGCLKINDLPVTSDNSFQKVNFKTWNLHDFLFHYIPWPAEQRID